MREELYGLARVKNVYSFWGDYPWLYAMQDFITFLGRPRLIRNRAVKKLELKEGGKVLEVACGTGRNFPYLQDVIGGRGKLVGFDYTSEMLAGARRLCEVMGWGNVTLIQGDAAELDVREKDFDGVLCTLGFSAIPHFEQALKRCKDVLRSGGRLAVCDARLFGGRLKFLNPLVKSIYSNFAAWDPSKNITEKMGALFGNVEIENLNLGSFFIATSVKET